MIDDLSAASGLNKSEWTFRYINDKNYYPLNKDEIKKRVPLSPKAYRMHVSEPIKEMKTLSGLSVYEPYQLDNDIETLMHRAGIYSRNK